MDGRRQRLTGEKYSVFNESFIVFLIIRGGNP